MKAIIKLKNIIKNNFFASENSVLIIEKYLRAKSIITKSIYRYKLIKKYGIFIGNNVRIGKNLYLPHPNGIVIGSGVSIGNNVTIYQQVTIGLKNKNEKEYPCIGNNVVIYAGAKIIGGLTIGEETIIGANSVLTTNTEKKSTYVGVPAKRVK